MPMPSYSIYCYAQGCKNVAEYKIAARWSDGVQSELKTYSLCCENCLQAEFTKARGKQSHCRLTTGETLEPPGIYRLTRGQRDQRLERLPDVEQRLQ